MSTSERLFDGAFSKWLVMASGAVPGVLLAWDAWHGQLGVNEVNFAIRTTGMVGIVLITLSLLITPLRALTGWNMLLAVRRNLGVLGFMYLATHFLIFFAFDRMGDVSSTLSEIIQRRYLWFGASALFLMIPLALTSTDGMISRLGPTRWKWLHRFSYFIAIGSVVHYFLLVKSDVRLPLAFAVAVGLLLGYRLVSHYVGLRAAARASLHRVTAAPRKRKFWSGELRVARIFDESHDVKTFRLVAVDGGPLPFDHTAGQYLNLSLTIDGKRVNRSYTIASPPTRSAFCEISVKQAADGYASRHLHQTWREGQTVKVSAPAGTFVFAGHESKRVVLVAGGIGITPMMSIVRSLTDRGWGGEVYLLFSVKAVRDFVFRDELEYLQSRFKNLHVRTLISRDTDSAWDGPRGQITREVVSNFIPEVERGPVLVCGPEAMMAAMRAIFTSLGVPDADVHQEAFNSPLPVEPPVAGATADVPLSGGELASIAFTRSEKTAAVTGEQTVLEASEEAGIAIPFECRSGICGQCKTRLISGRVTMEVQDALTHADRSRGFILACQAHATRDLEVDA